VVLSRFAEYQGLEGAFVRRAITERAKGMLMERHSVDEKRAFEMLRDEARRSSRKMIAIAEAVTVSVNLLPGSPVEWNSVREVDVLPSCSPLPLTASCPKRP
jgi:ANTAR domain